MPDVMKTLLLNPPSFENFDGGASSRWPATREIESYWYPVWLTYPAGMIPGSRLLDASPHKVNWQQTIEICKDYEFLILFTSTVGLESDVKLIRKIKEANPSMKIAFVGPHGHIKPEETLNASEDIDFVTRGEFDHSVVDYAHGKPLSEISGVSYRKDGKIVHNAERPQLHTEELDALPCATDIYKRDLEIERYNVPFLLHPYVSFYTTRGCPALCTFCMWPQTISRPARQDKRDDSEDPRLRKGIGLRDHPGFAGPCHAGDGITRHHGAARLPESRSSGGFRWSSIAAHRVPAPVQGGNDGGRQPLLR